MRASMSPSSGGHHLQSVGLGTTGTHFLRPAMFPYPSRISADQASKTSAGARRILARAIVLCRPRRPGHTLQCVADEELAELAQEGRALLEHQAPDVEGVCPFRDEERSFDGFFGIRRHASADALAIGVAWGVLAMIHEASRPHSLVPAELAALTSGFFRLAAPFVTSLDGTSVREDAIEPALPQSGRVIERWLNGHLTFVALTDGLIFAHLRAIAALQRGEMAEGAIALRDASCLFTASAAAMRLTGDMQPHDFHDARFAMNPPHVPEGFSGLFNADHRRLLGLIQGLGELLREPSSQLEWALEEYWQALNDASLVIAGCASTS